MATLITCSCGAVLRCNRLSERALAALHPPPDPKLLGLLYIAPFRVAYNNKLAYYEPPESEGRSNRRAGASAEDLSKDDAVNAEIIFGSCLPTRLRPVMKVRLSKP